MSNTTGAPAFRLSSDPIPLPVRKGGGVPAEVHVLYDVGACFDLETPSLYRAVVGADLLGRFRRSLRAPLRLALAWDAAYPDGERVKETDATDEKPATYRRFTDAEQDDYDAARDANEAESDRLTAEATAIHRELYLAVIGHTVILVEGEGLEQSPDPSVPADWDAWPTPVLQWLAETGTTAAKESVRSKKS